MIKSIDLKYGILLGVVGFTLTLFGMYYATGMLDPRFPAVIGVGLFGGGFLGSLLRRLHKEGEERKASFIFLTVLLIVGLPLITEHTRDILTGNWKIWKFVSIFAFIYLIGYAILRVMKSKDVKT